MNFLYLGAVVVGSVVAYAIFSSFSTPKRKRNARLSIEVPGQQAVAGEGLPRRTFHSVDRLITFDPDIPTLHHIFIHAASKYPNHNCLGYRPLINIISEEKVIDGVKKKWEYFHLGQYVWITYKEALERVKNVSAGLRALGVNPGDKLGIYEDTRIEWTLAAHAAFSQSVVLVTVYANLGEEGLMFAINEGKLEYVMTNGKLLKPLASIISQCPSVKAIVYTDEPEKSGKETLEAKGIKLISFTDLEELGKKNPTAYSIPKPDDLAVIMYTSGSTGNPKGVMIPHKALLATINGVAGRISLTPKDVYISYLPLAHVLALASQSACLQYGVAVGYANPRSLLDAAVRNCRGDLSELRPTLMAGVPTVWDRVRKGALTKIEHGSPIVKFLFNLAFKAKSAALAEGLDTPFWNALIFKKFKTILGGRMRLMVSGGAPLSKETHNFLKVCFCVPVVQGYGLTETCGGGTIQEEDEYETGRVGPPVSCSEIKLVDCPELGYTSNDKPYPRGEIWIRGQNVTNGYFNQPEKTAEDFKAGGWFATGDIGQWPDNGSLEIIDRKKNLIKLSHGEYIALEKLESIYKTSTVVESICVFANSFLIFPVAVVHPVKAQLSNWAQKNNIQNPDSLEALCNNPKAKAFVLESLTEVAKKAHLKSFEFIKDILLVPEEWTPENGMLTAAMKVKRTEVEKNHKEGITKMYNNPQLKG